MGQYYSKLDQEYDKLIDILDNIIYNWNAQNDCESILKTNSLLIKLKAHKLAQDNPELIIKLIKLYPETKLYLFEILGNNNIQNISIQLDDYNL
jgi:hypothetical protein